MPDIDKDTSASSPLRLRRGSDDAGVVLPWVALTIVVLIAMAGFGVDVWNWWYSGQRAQRAADAGALAGVVFLPGDLSTAKTTARQLAARNGFNDGIFTSGAPVNATVTAEKDPDNGNRLVVTVQYTVTNYFVSMLGLRHTTITREAEAEYQGPVPLGSPTNNLGNQPGTDTWLSGTTPPVANTNPQLWGNIAGPNTDKVNGDRFATSFCTNDFACSSSVNTEFNSSGYVFIVRINASTSDVSNDRRIAVQMYDPAFVQTGDTCSTYVPSGGTDETNVENALRALAVPQYNPDNKQYCPGDHYIRGGYETNNPTTNVAFYAPDATQTLTDNPQVTASGCSAQSFSPIVGAALTDTNSLPNLLAATNLTTNGLYAKKVFHAWVPICDVKLSTLNITEAGTYDVVLRLSTTGGAGHNRFALRGGITTAAGATTADGTDVSLFAAENLPMYMNASGSNTQFYLARIFPGADGRILNVEFYDVGDAAANGTITVLPPTEAKSGGSGGTALTSFSCTYTRSDNASLTTDNSQCQLQNVNASTGFNGRKVTARIPIPNGYWCDAASSFGCWVRLRFDYPTGTGVSDTTTWTANILGDPVRLVK